MVGLHGRSAAFMRDILANRIIEHGDEVGQNTGEIKCRERLGGILHTTIAALHKCKGDERSPPGATPTTRKAHHPRHVLLRLPFEATTFYNQPVPCHNLGRDSANSPCQSLYCQTGWVGGINLRYGKNRSTRCGSTNATSCRPLGKPEVAVDLDEHSVDGLGNAV